jgi:trigger factor
MDISLLKNDDLTATIKIVFEKEDYKDEYDKELRKVRKETNIPGFRPGLAPLSLIEKKVGKSILSEVIEKKISAALSDYLKEVDVVLNPISSEKHKSVANFDNPDKFEFYFDVLLRPEIEFDYENEKIELPLYKVDVTDEDIDNRIKLYRQQFGKWDEVDERKTEKAIVYGVLEEISHPENSEPLKIENVPFIQDSFTSKEKSEEFQGLKKGESMEIDVENDIKEADLKYIFKDKKYDSKNFKYTVSHFKEYKEAEVGKELFEKLYGEEITEEEFRKRIKEELEREGERLAKDLFRKELENYLLEKIKIDLPEAFLKRYLLERGNKPEDVEKYWEETLRSLKFDIIIDYLMKKMDIKITEEEIDNLYTDYAKGYLMQYGITNFDGNEEILNQVKESLYKDENLYNQIFLTIALDKIVDVILEKSNPEEKKISFAELEKLYNEKVKGNSK